MSLVENFVNYLHERSREHHNTFRFVGLREHGSFYIRARLAILERLSQLEEWDENRD